MLVLITLQLIGCDKLNAVAVEGVGTATEIMKEKQSFTQKIAEILFGKEEEPVQRIPHIKDYDFPEYVKSDMRDALLGYYNMTDEDIYYYVRDLYSKSQNGEIPFNGGMDFLVFNAFMSSYTENEGIFNGQDYADWLGVPLDVRGYYRQTFDYDFDEELVWIEGHDSFDYYIRIPLGDSAKWQNGDEMLVFGQFLELLYDEDRSAGYTRYVISGANLVSQLCFNLTKDIDKDYVMTPEEKEFFLNTEYTMVTEGLEENAETGEMEKVYEVSEFDINEKEVCGYPYTVKSITKVGPDIELMYRLDDTHYDDNIYDKITFRIDGTIEFVYSYLDINQDYTKETPADYYGLGWRMSNIF